MEGNYVRYVICYDVQNDKRRTRLAKMLDGYGDRAQFSVFEAALDQQLFEIMVDKAKAIINPEEDRVTIYRICAACAKLRTTLGRSEGEPLPGEEIVFIA